jgi:hypothetical protein
LWFTFLIGEEAAMSHLERTPGLMEALKGEMTPKFLATRSTEGVPNVVPVVSILPADDQPDLLFFGNFLLRKSIHNLQEDPRVGILVMTQQLNGWLLKGDFLEFQRTGPYVDKQMNSALLRYNPYTGIRNAGLIRVSAVTGSFRISKLQVALDYFLTKLGVRGKPASSEGTVAMPLPARREFAKMVAVKVLAWLGEDGYPVVVPMLSLQPVGEQTLVGRTNSRLPAPPSNVPAAANILTFEAVSYQAKGSWTSKGRTGRLLLEEVYAGGPPIPGGRVA